MTSGLGRGDRRLLQHCADLERLHGRTEERLGPARQRLEERLGSDLARFLAMALSALLDPSRSWVGYDARRALIRDYR